MRTLLVAVALAGCHQPPTAQADALSCTADSASVCELQLDGFQRACTDGKGHKCARCYPTDPALDRCYLDGTTSGVITGATAVDWVVCVHDCNLCTPKEALAVDPTVRCAVPGDNVSTDLGGSP